MLIYKNQILLCNTEYVVILVLIYICQVSKKLDFLLMYYCKNLRLTSTPYIDKCVSQTIASIVK